MPLNEFQIINISLIYPCWLNMTNTYYFQPWAMRHTPHYRLMLHYLVFMPHFWPEISSDCILVAVKDSGDIAEIILIQGSKYFTPLESNFPSLVSSCCILNVLMSADKEVKREFHKKGIIIMLIISIENESILKIMNKC